MRSIGELLARRASLTPHRGGYFFRDPFGTLVHFDWANVYRRVLNLTESLNRLGIQSGNMVAICGKNSCEWAIVDLAIATLGAVSVGLDETWPAKRIVEYMADLNVKYIVLGREQMQAPQELFVNPQKYELTQIAGCEGGLRYILSNPESVLSRPSVSASGDIATIVFTSGSDGKAKPAMISHRAILNLVERISESHRPMSEIRLISYLPLCHAIGRLLSIYLPLNEGGSVYFSRGYEHLADELRSVRPTVFLGVPRVWEKIQSGIEDKLARTPLKNIRINELLSGSANGKKSMRRLTRSVMRRIIRYRVGLNKAELLLSGAAPLNTRVQTALHNWGLTVVEAYGQTESIVTTLSTPNCFRVGTVGRPLNGTEVRVSSDGELLIMNNYLFSGYYADSVGTSETVENGWLRSGDLGTVDADGFVSVFGRKKSILITSVGNKIAAEPIENMLNQIPTVGQAIVIGNGRKYLVALIAPSKEFASATERARSIADIDGVIEQFNMNSAPYERIGGYRLIDRPFSGDLGESTRLGKPIRNCIEKNFASTIAEMYEENRINKALKASVGA
jgi:long-chain acyl-CoA synthetase